MGLRLIFEVYERGQEFVGGGRHIKPWWRQEELNEVLRDMLTEATQDAQPMQRRQETSDVQVDGGPHVSKGLERGAEE